MAWKNGVVIKYTDHAWQANCFKCDYCSVDCADEHYG